MNWFKNIHKNLFSKKVMPDRQLNISDDPYLNEIHKAPDLTMLYANDLMVYYDRLQRKNDGKGVTMGEFQTLIAYYAIDLLIEYHDKANGVLPRSIIQDVKNNVLAAAQKKFPAFNDKGKADYFHYMVDNYIKLKDIVSSTKRYMESLE